MTIVDAEPSPRRAATAAGIGLLAMAVLAFWSFSAFNDLVVAEDAAKTAQNIAGHELRFRALICGFLIVAVLDVVVAWALRVLLAPVGRSVATFCAWLRVAYAAVFAAVLSNLLIAVRLPTESGPRNAFTARQVEAQVLTAVNAFKDGWDAALVIFSLHLLVLGHLLLRSRLAPRTLGALVMIAGAGYAVDGVGTILFADHDAGIARFTFVGEVLLIVWLLWKGSRPSGLGTREPSKADSPVRAPPSHGRGDRRVLRRRSSDTS